MTMIWWQCNSVIVYVKKVNVMTLTGYGAGKGGGYNVPGHGAGT